MSYALITGASSGIGYELAKVFAENKHNVILIARREERLNDLARELEEIYGVRAHVLYRDLSQPQSVTEIYEWIEKNDIRVEFLVNNAGFVVYGNISDTPWDEEQKMMQLHMHTSTHLIKRFLPEMLENNRGRILNIGSTGSFVPGPYAAVYCATKSFLLSISEAIAEEIRGTAVTITTLCPGGTKTEFAQKAKRKRETKAESRGMDAEKVARIAYRSLIKGKRVVIPGLLNKIQVFAIRLLPRIVVVRFTGMMMLKHK
ncbi:MAG: hypothetical protein AMS26_11445 [Bacteroides sp. SM23_62]|nr:MAG: hypothetical protein AMS26_11445 [Bacteroides sp. SM23_62]